MKQLELSAFLNDVVGHTMKVRHNDGLYRHLSCRREGPNSWNLWFDVITWPGSLTIHGDMGSWTFSRIDDMFSFFRCREGLKINPSYWAEKCDSVDSTTGGIKVWEPETFEANVLSDLENYDLELPLKRQVRDALYEQVFRESEEWSARQCLDHFEYEKFRFSDTWEISGRTWNYRFLWNLYAIVWSIQKWDGFLGTANENHESLSASPEATS